MDPVNIMTQQLTSITREAIALLPQLLLAIIIIGLTYLVSHGLRAILKRAASHRLRRSLQNLVELLINLGIWSAGFHDLPPSSCSPTDPHQGTGRSGDRLCGHRFCLQGCVREFLAGSSF
ncbi:MAG: hypothetical protein R3E95_08465 [Thiolinea sp.]